MAINSLTPSTVLATTSAFTARGQERFDQAVTAVENRQEVDAGYAHGASTQYPLNHRVNVSDASRAYHHSSPLSSLGRAMWRARFPMVALRKIAGKVNRHPQFLPAFAGLLERTFQDAGIRIEYEPDFRMVTLAPTPRAGLQKMGVSADDFVHKAHNFLRQIGEITAARFETVTTASGMKWYVAKVGESAYGTLLTPRIMALVGPHGAPLPMQTLTAYIYRHPVLSGTLGSDDLVVHDVDSQGYLRLRKDRSILKSGQQRYSVLPNGTAQIIPPKAEANAYCVDSDKKCWIRQEGDAFHFIVYDYESRGGTSGLPAQSENTVIWNNRIFLRQKDGSFVQAPYGYYGGSRLIKFDSGGVRTVEKNAVGHVMDTVESERYEYFPGQLDLYFDPEKRVPIAFWHPKNKRWVLLGTRYKSYNPVYEGQTYFVPEGHGGRYYTAAEMAELPLAKLP